MMYRIEMREGSTKKIEGVRFSIDEIGRLLVYKDQNGHSSQTSPLSEQTLVFVANIGEWATIEVVE